MSATLKSGEKLLMLHQSEIQRNDIVLFEENTGESLISRIVALPGDSLQIINSFLFVNGKKELFINQCDFYTVSQKVLSPHLTTKIYDTIIPFIEATTLIHDSSYFIKKKIIPSSFGQKEIFPQNNGYYYWNKDNVGKLILPAKGDKIRLTKQNAAYFLPVIVKFENFDKTKNIAELNNESLYYTFQNNYGFLLNDNRTNIEDSRTLGIVPIKKLKPLIQY